MHFFNLQAGQYEVRGYPTIKFFAPGKKDSDSVSDYDGGRTSSDIVTWALDKLAESVPAPEIVQILDEKSLKKACEDKPLCIVSVLPHILDCQSECRNNYLTILKTLGEKFKKKMWGYVSKIKTFFKSKKKHLICCVSSNTYPTLFLPDGFGPKQALNKILRKPWRLVVLVTQPSRQSTSRK